MSNVLLFLYSFLLVSGLMTIVWVMQLKNKNAGIVDVVWAISFMCSTILFSLLIDGYAFREYIVIGLVSCWCVRLGYHLFIRNWGEPEDARYASMREKWGAKANLNMFLFFQFQALASAILSFPFVLILRNPSYTFSGLEILGVLLFAIAIIGEAASDSQLKQFKRTAKKMDVCTVGLWNYSRHPNYFFEWLIWVSIFIIALPTPYGWVALYCPLLMWHFLNNVTGIAITELHMLQTRGNVYLNYQKATSAFIPWFKLKR